MAALAFIVMWSATRTRAQMNAQRAISSATPDSSTDLRECTYAARPSLSLTERQMVDWVLHQSGTVLSLPVAAIMREAGVNQPTVIRSCRSMGCHGPSGFKLRLAQGDVTRDTAPARIATPSGMRVPQNAIDSLTTLQDCSNPHTFSAAVTLVDSAHRIGLYGFGSSGVVALDVRTKFFRYGTPADVYSGLYLVLMSLGVLQAGDVVTAISKSGALPELQTAVERVRGLGVRVIAVTTPGGLLATLADVVLPVGVDDIVVDRSMAACLLHLALLDALALEVMLRKGSALQHMDQPEQR